MSIFYETISILMILYTFMVLFMILLYIVIKCNTFNSIFSINLKWNYIRLFLYNIAFWFIFFKSSASSIIIYSMIINSGIWQYTFFMFMFTVFFIKLILTVMNITVLQKATCVLSILFMFISNFLLWTSKNIFTIILCIDLLNLSFLFVQLVFLKNKKYVYYDTRMILDGLVSYFWQSFFATSLLILICALIANTFHTQNIILILVNFSFLKMSILYNATVQTAVLNLFILLLMIKLGIGPFFIWKKYAFISWSINALIIYISYYLTILYIYFINITISIATICSYSLWPAIIISLFMAAIWLFSVIESGMSARKYIYVSTVFSSIFCLLGLLTL